AIDPHGGRSGPRVHDGGGGLGRGRWRRLGFDVVRRGLLLRGVEGALLVIDVVADRAADNGAGGGTDGGAFPRLVAVVVADDGASQTANGGTTQSTILSIGSAAYATAAKGRDSEGETERFVGGRGSFHTLLSQGGGVGGSP